MRLDKLSVDIDYKTSAYIGKHSCSKCGADFKLNEGLMVGTVEDNHKATIFICEKCLEKHTPYQTPEFLTSQKKGIQNLV
jgi:protein-arginine kinase activator protein McsA